MIFKKADKLRVYLVLLSRYVRTVTFISMLRIMSDLHSIKSLRSLTLLIFWIIKIISVRGILCQVWTSSKQANISLIYISQSTSSEKELLETGLDCAV